MKINNRNILIIVAILIVIFFIIKIYIILYKKKKKRSEPLFKILSELYYTKIKYAIALVTICIINIFKSGILSIFIYLTF